MRLITKHCKSISGCMNNRESNRKNKKCLTLSEVLCQCGTYLVFFLLFCFFYRLLQHLDNGICSTSVWIDADHSFC